MTAQLDEARSAVQKARQALRDNHVKEARQWAERAAALAPQMEDPWLILAAVASPRASVEYIQQALKINPTSPRARRGLEWALQRQRENIATAKVKPQATPTPAGSQPPAASKRKSIFPYLLFGLGCLVCALAAVSASSYPVIASILENPPSAAAAVPTHPPSWAQAYIPKPTYTPQLPSGQTASDDATPVPTSMVDVIPSDLPTDVPTDMPTQPAIPAPVDTLVPTIDPTLSSNGLTLEYVQDTPTSDVPTDAAQPGPNVSGGEHWIDVNLTQQKVYAYEGNTVVNTFIVSTGTWQFPTVTGQYHIYVKLRYTDMAGPGYYLPNVPYTMYFYEGYGLHGTYWHHNFGVPMSHGCVNLATPDAAWLYNWASVGTLVNIHY